MAEEIGELDLTAQANAAQTATNYITAIDSDGIKVHAANNASTNYAGIDATGMDVVKGGASVAKFGETTRIGKEYVQGATNNESHMELDYHSLQMIDREGTAYFHVSDLRDTYGYATITQTFTGNGATDRFYVTMPVRSRQTTSATVDGVSVSISGISANYLEVQLSSVPSNGAEVVITYQTSDSMAKAYTIGIRGSGDVGASSIAEGNGCVASGYLSKARGDGSVSSGRGSLAIGLESIASGSSSIAVGEYSTASGTGSVAIGDSVVSSGIRATALGIGTVAVGQCQLVIGRYNEQTHAPFVIGDGVNDDDRATIFAVGYEGRVYTARDILLTSTSNMSSIITAASGITIDIFKFCQRSNVASILLRAKKSTATAANTAISVGTIVAGRRPPFECAGPGTSGVGDCWVDETGSVKFRSTSQIAASANFYVRITYPVA